MWRASQVVEKALSDEKIARKLHEMVRSDVDLPDQLIEIDGKYYIVERACPASHKNC